MPSPLLPFVTLMLSMIMHVCPLNACQSSIPFEKMQRLLLVSLITIARTTERSLSKQLQLVRPQAAIMHPFIGVCCFHLFHQEASGNTFASSAIENIQLG
jgi:hypothetical protein